MQNDVLKNNIAPWQEKGRWYHLQVESDGSAWKINKDKSDNYFQNSVFTGGALIYIDDAELNTYKKTITDLKFILRAPCTAGTALFTNAFNVYFGSTRQYIVLPAVSTITGVIDVWAFISE